ncbi:MAG: hypothetical protein ACOYKA_02365 [Legionellaceae bacterium]
MQTQSLEEQCNELCGNTRFEYLSSEEKEEIAPQLALWLLKSNAVNTVWESGEPCPMKNSLIDTLRYLDDELIGQLFEKGLDLNIIVHSGVSQFTFMIGNAEYSYATYLLKMSEQHQTREQRLIWINKPDAMKVEMDEGIRHVYQTPVVHQIDC